MEEIMGNTFTKDPDTTQSKGLNFSERKWNAKVTSPAIKAQIFKLCVYVETKDNFCFHTNINQP